MKKIPSKLDLGPFEIHLVKGAVEAPALPRLPVLPISDDGDDQGDKESSTRRPPRRTS